MSITMETRRESYQEVTETLSKRQGDVLTELGKFAKVGMTAGELALHMNKMGYFPTPERNAVHPRLNELVIKGRIEVSGKRSCRVSGKTCAVYQTL